MTHKRLKNEQCGLPYFLSVLTDFCFVENSSFLQILYLELYQKSQYFIVLKIGLCEKEMKKAMSYEKIKLKMKCVKGF